MDIDEIVDLFHLDFDIWKVEFDIMQPSFLVFNCWWSLKYKDFDDKLLKIWNNCNATEIILVEQSKSSFYAETNQQKLNECSNTSFS